MPTCITGMHRSGTSMIARIANLGGLYLGPPEEIMPPFADNPRGFWENILFLGISKAIINKFGHDEFDKMPFLLQPNWQNIEGLNTTYMWARRLCHGMQVFNNDEDTWGWKDPRVSLVLPFWYEVVPDLRVVICARHPENVFASLAAREKGFGRKLAMDSWYAYNFMALENAREHLVVLYHKFFEEPEKEIGRLFSFCGLRDMMGTRAKDAAKTVHAEDRHHVTEPDDVTGLPGRAVDLWLRLLEEGEA